MADQKITQLNENTAPASGDFYVIVDDPSGSPESQKIDHDNLFSSIGMLNLKDSGELTISSGAVTATGSFHTIDTEGDAASDDLDTINGGSVGDILIISPNNAARTVVAKDATGDLILAGDFSMDDNRDTLMLLHDGTNWRELSRSNNV